MFTAPPVPKTVAECADLLYTTRQERLALQREVDEMSKFEGTLKTAILTTLPKGEATGIAGHVARVTVLEKDEPQVTDWTLLHAHIQKTGEFDLLQRRIGSTAAKERWEAGLDIPGVGHNRYEDLSCVKV